MAEVQGRSNQRSDPRPYRRGQGALQSAALRRSEDLSEDERTKRSARVTATSPYAYVSTSAALHLRYGHVRLDGHDEEVFIGHHTEANEMTEEGFFHKGKSGGTFISSGYQKALDIIAERYHPSLWNIYAFHCSDGDNFDSDNLVS